jgi:CTP-dependent riboflavin kinase
VRVLRGTVATGIGDLAQWMVRYADLYEECTGVRLYPGSLNIVLGEAYHLPPDPPMRLPPGVLGGKVGMNIVPCSIMGLSAFVLRTDQNEAGQGDHPPHVIEIAAAVCLRDEFGLTDGDTVTVEIEEDE